MGQHHEDFPWVVLMSSALAAEKNGQWHQASKLSGAARDAWVRHCRAEDAKEDAKKRAGRRKRAIEDFEYEQNLERGRGR
jgi:hypothetical protein